MFVSQNEESTAKGRVAHLERKVDVWWEVGISLSYSVNIFIHAVLKCDNKH